MDDPGDVLVPSVAEAARRAGLHRSTLASWVACGLVHRSPEGIHLSEVLEVKEAREEARRRRPTSESEFWLAQVRKRRAEALALGNLRRSAQLVPSAWVAAQFEARVALIERDLHHLAERLAPELVRMGVAPTRAARLHEELEVLARAYGRPLPAPPPPPHGEVEEVEETDDYEADALPHDDVRDP